MISADIIIIGGGPAGAACGWKLKQGGRDVLILDKAGFPRLKLCAGWITPRVLKNLKIKAGDYPHGIVNFHRLHFHVYNIPIPVPTRQFSIRRIEFDSWLLERAGVTVEKHLVRRIEQQGGSFIIDEMFRCNWLVGAGGTNCPVYRAIFRDARSRDRRNQIVSMELEFQAELLTNHCHLWFFQQGLPGYSWYVPKPGGWLNIGIGGKHAALKKHGGNIREHWEKFVDFLVRKGFLVEKPPAPGTYSYFLRQKGTVQRGQAMIIGDSAGLATVDMGEGIGPAIESGLLAAEAILTGNSLSFATIPRFSFPGILFHWKR